MTQLMVDYLCTIFQCTDDPKGSSAHKVFQMWPAQYNQFGSYKMSFNDSGGEVPQIRDPKSIQTKIDCLPKEKALHAAVVDKVHQRQATIKNGAIVEANSAVVDLAAFNDETRITESLDLLSDAEAVVDLDHEGSSLRLSWYLSKAMESLEEG